MARPDGWKTSLGFLVTLAVTAGTAAAQTSSSLKWEVEFHGGFAAATVPTAGSAAPLPAGLPFVPLPDRPSRIVASWLFGEGAVLINASNAVLAPSTRITPLDPVLGRASVSRGSGAALGFRLTRRLGSRYFAELNVDYARTPLKFSDEALDGIEASRATFVSALRGLFVSGPAPNPSVSAATTFTDAGRAELATTGVFGVDLLTTGRLIPYVVGGAGVAHAGDEGPSAELLGSYAFPVPGTTVGINDTDRVTLRVETRANSPVGVFGGGFRYAASSRWGIRGDVRFLLGGVRNNLLLDASPTVGITNPGVILITPTNPSAVFSSSAFVPSSLSGPDVSGFRTFTGSGSSLRTNITAGVYIRF